ncbi:D-alanyl-D-alanine carboxypeptidase/D-alanyl-D-alanine-endopeptidase [candidate division KSB1 bacterium]|nr:D-alanyl-D-alanine carboxypeptidase/D-alanyl-D-alanine-endopeptidase [candidate division KSB1 bacterium]
MRVKLNRGGHYQPGVVLILALIWPVLLSAAGFNVQHFKSQLNTLLAQKTFKNVRMGIVVRQLPDGPDWFTLNEQQAFMPASTLKLILSAAVIHNYQAAGAFQTPARYHGALNAGILSGDLYLQGTGAPTISLDSLTQTVRRLKQSGLREITGNLIYDDRAFKAQTPRFPPMARDRWAPGGALVLNSNRIEIKITARTPKLIFEKIPNTAYAQIKADLTYTNSDQPSSPEMRYEMKPEGDWYTLKGTVTRWTENTHYLALGATRPGLFFATVFKESLVAGGIQFQGKIIAGVCNPELPVLAWMHSPPLKQLLLEMNTASDNIIAENLFWKLGLDKLGAPADNLKGAQSLQQFVNEITPAPEFKCADGSGLSPASQIAPLTFIKLMSYFYQHAPDLISVLPIEGPGSARYAVHAKSGTLSMNGLNALAGYITPKKSGATYAFVIFGQRHPNPSKLWSGTLTHPVIQLILDSIQAD